jgi:hypothetical protein
MYVYEAYSSSTGQEFSDYITGKSGASLWQKRNTNPENVSNRSD